MAKELTEQEVLSALSKVQDPGLGQDLVSSNSIAGMRIKGADVNVDLRLITPLHPALEQIKADVTAALEQAGASKVIIGVEASVPSDGRTRTAGGTEIKNVVAIASGKGGVGKSTVSVNVAVALAQAGASVGLLDADIYGPNIPTMMGVEQLPPQSGQGNTLTPAEAYGVKMMSIGFLVKPEQAMIWRGPMLHTALRQFMEDVIWGDLDYLIVDMPPGTGDVQLSLAQSTPISGGVIVTLPQRVSVDDARRGAEMFRQLQVPLFGVVENMSYMELPDGQRVEVFGSGGGEALAKEFDIPFIGGLPMEADVRSGGDSGKPVVFSKPDSAAAQAFKAIAADISLKVSAAALTSQGEAVPISMTDD